MVPVKMLALFITFMICNQFVASQRSPYAGGRPSGYKDRFTTKQNGSTSANSIETDVVNRFGENNDGTQRPPVGGVAVVQGVQGSVIENRNPEIPSNSAPAAPATVNPSRLPYDARGDADLVNLLLSRPAEQRPFWLINYQLIEAQRNSSRQENYNPIAARSFFLGK